MFNRRHMQGSFGIKTVKKLLICHCHRHLRRATCSTLQCREQLNSVKSHCDKQRDWDIDCAMCFPCQNGKKPSQRNLISLHHTGTQWEPRDATVHWRYAAMSDLCYSVNMPPALDRSLLGSRVMLSCGAQRAHTETFSANICLRYFSGWRSSDLIPSFKVGSPYQCTQRQVCPLLLLPGHSKSNSARVHSQALDGNHPHIAGKAPNTTLAQTS